MTLHIPTLQTDRLTLRALRAGDHAAFADFYGSDRSRFVGGPASPEQAWRMLAMEIGHWTLRGFGRWGVEDCATGTLVGVIGPWYPADWPEPEIGWDLMNGCEGQGYATEAARAALDHAFNVLKWPSAISMVADGNTASDAVAERLGARRDGTFDHPHHGKMTVWRHPTPEQRGAQ